MSRFQSRPVDTAHSEYQGLAKLLIGTIFDTVLTAAAAVEADEVLRKYLCVYLFLPYTFHISTDDFNSLLNPSPQRAGIV